MRGELTDSLSFQLGGEWVRQAEIEKQVLPGNVPGTNDNILSFRVGSRMRSTVWKTSI